MLESHMGGKGQQLQFDSKKPAECTKLWVDDANLTQILLLL